MTGVWKCLANKSNLTLFDVSHQINLEVTARDVADLFALHQEITGYFCVLSLLSESSGFYPTAFLYSTVPHFIRL